MNLPESVLRRPITTLMLLLSLMILGATALGRLPLAFMPQIVEPEVSVQANRSGAPTWVVEETVTRPLEEELSQLPGYKRIVSSTNWRRAEVELFFDWGTDIDLKKAEVREAVERVRPDLPSDVTGLSVSADIADFGDRAMVSGRISSGRDLSDSYDLIELKILRPIERIPGVASVEINGVEPKRVSIEMEPEALTRHGITPQEVMRALDGGNVDVSAGVIREGGHRRPVRAVSAFQELEEIQKLPVRPGLHVEDLGTVRYEEPPRWVGRHLDGEFAIGIDIQKEPTANTVEVVERIKAVVADINADPSMKGVNFLIWHNEAEQIQKSLRGLRNAGVFGGILAIGMLLFFLRRIRTTLIVAVAIPFSLIASCAFLYLLGRELNVLTLLGLMLGVGMLVDNSVVVIENIHRYREQGLEPRLAARKGASEVTLAVTAATATTLCVWLPFLTGAKSELSIMIGEVAVAMCLTIGASLLISLTFIPLASAKFLSADPEPEPGVVQRMLDRGYGTLLRWTLRHRFVTLALLLALCGSIWFPFHWLEKEPEPSFQEPDVNVRLEFADSVTAEKTEAAVVKIEEAFEKLREPLGFQHVYSYFGDGFGGIRVFWPQEKASEEVLEAGAAALREAAPRLPGVNIAIGEESSRAMRQRWRRGGGEMNRFPLVLRGQEMDFLMEKSAELEPILRQIPGVLDVQTSRWGRHSQDELHIVVDRELAGVRGVTPQQVASTIDFQFQGRSLRRFRTGDKEVDVFLGVQGWDTEGYARLLDLRIPTEEGMTALAGLAQFRRAKGRNDIRKEDGIASWTLMIEHEPGRRGEVMSAVGRRLRAVPFPEGSWWEFSNWNRNRESWAHLMTGFGLALLLVYIVMASLFESTAQPIAILISLPLAGAGALWILWVAGARFDMPAFIGCIVLLGIVVNNGIVLIDHVNQYRRQGLPLEDALVRGAGERLRPILMTAVTTILGLAPMAAGRFTVANIYIDTMAYAVIGGLTTSTLLTLLALPTWASLLHDVAVAFRRLDRATGERPVPDPG